MSFAPKIQKLDSLVVVQVDVNIWSGQTKLRPEDFHLGVGGTLPPEKVALLGSKKIVDSYSLRPFNRVKSRVNRKLKGIGIEFLNGFAIPADKVDEATLLLEQSQDEFQLEKNKFVQNYVDLVDSWARDNPELEESILQSALTTAEVESKLGFEYQMFQISPLADEAIHDKMNSSVERLGGNLLSEVANQADEFYRTNFLGKKQVGIRTQDTLRNIRDRLDGLSFLDGRIMPLVGLINEVLTGYGQYAEGRFVVEPFLWKLTGAVLILSDIKRMEEYISGDITMDSMGATVSGQEGVWSIQPPPQTNLTINTADETVDGNTNAKDTNQTQQEEQLGLQAEPVTGQKQEDANSSLADDLASIEEFFGKSESDPVDGHQSNTTEQQSIVNTENDQTEQSNVDRFEGGVIPPKSNAIGSAPSEDLFF